MKQVLMLRYKSTKISKHYEYINGKNDHNLLTFFLIQTFPEEIKSKRTFPNRSWKLRIFHLPSKIKNSKRKI